MLSIGSVIFVLVLFHAASHGLESNKQNRYNPSVDFLAHEAGHVTGSAWSKKENTIVQSNNDYNSQFPSLGSPPSTPLTKPTTSPSGKRDYVAPQIPTQAPLNNGKRDYVAPQHPTTKPQLSAHRDYVAPQQPTQRQQPSGKRDYVAAQLPTLKPQISANQDHVAPQSPIQKLQPSGKRDYVAPQFTQRPTSTGNTGRVKDLINFYEKPKEQNGPQKVPSYSSILQGNNNSGSSIQTLTNTKPIVLHPTTAKPQSFSAVVGGNKPNVQTTSVTQPQKNITPLKPSGNLTPTPQPGVPVLPSSLLTNNRNNNHQGTTNNNNNPTDAELQTLSEELLRKDSNNAAKYITINYQQKTTSQSKEDKAPQPLLVVAPDAWNIPTVQKLVPLLDNYERDTMVNEHVTAQERNEENAFIDSIMNTAVIRHLMNFLKEKGFVPPDPKQQRDYLKQLWFNLYSRGKGKISSSGFEHVFVSELKNGDVQGLHNWVYFSREETANRLNYLGYLKYQQFNDKGAVIKFHFNQQGVDKPVDTMFVGTSPELEIALYTLCFVTRADNDCQLKLGTKDVNIVTHTFRYRSKNHIGSAYPQI